MYFKGDIIITDPCYIIKEEYKDAPPYPDIKDYIGVPLKIEALDEENEDNILAYINSLKKYTERLKSTDYTSYEQACRKWIEEYGDDAEKCNHYEDMNVLGFTSYLTSSTIYGDWSCTTFNKDTGEVIGDFCADSGMVGVFLLEEVLKYNPDFDYHKYKPWTTTLIKDFDGEIKIEIIGEKVSVVGTGNINFFTLQTGL